MYSVTVSVEGIGSNYTLTDSDLRIVFGRFGEVLEVHPEGSAAVVTFANHEDAQRAIQELDNKLLSGVQEARLRVAWGFNENFPGMANHQHLSLAQQQLLHQQQLLDGRKFTCRFEIPIENDKEFQIARRVIGKSGANMKRIVATTDAKLRLRGRGSGYLEGFNRVESPEPLHLCVSATTKEGYEESVRKVHELLSNVFKEYQEFCASKSWPVPDLKVICKENVQQKPILMTPPMSNTTKGSPLLGPFSIPHPQNAASFWR
jgi:RNA recognition motif. (a.k.a. RRM, RBD, or RNP domain)